MNRISNWNRYIIVSCLVIPLLVFFFVSSVWGNKDINFVSELFFILFILVTCIALEKLDFRCNNYILYIVLFCGCFLSRLFYVLYMDKYVSQISDFLWILEESSMDAYVDRIPYYYRLFAHKYVYAHLLHVFHINTQCKILVFQTLIVSLISIELYIIGNNIFSKKIGLIAYLLYIFWPGQYVYLTVISEEHIAAAVIGAIIILLLLIYDECKKSNYRYGKLLVLSVVCGVLGGFCKLFKDWSTVAIVACIIMCIMMILTKKESRGARRRIVWSLIVLISIRFSFCGIVYNNISKNLGVQVDKNPMPIYMYVSMSPSASGAYDEKRYNEYNRFYEESGLDFSKADREALKRLSAEIRADKKGFEKLLLNKCKEAYANDIIMYSWAILMETDNSFVEQHQSKIVKSMEWSRVYYVCIILLMLAASFLLYWDKNEKLYLILLIILGGALTCLFIESQGRYKYSIEPIWCIPAAIGAVKCSGCLFKLVFQIHNKILKNKNC